MRDEARPAHTWRATLVYCGVGADRRRWAPASTSTTSASGPAASAGRTCSTAPRSARRPRSLLSGWPGLLADRVRDNERGRGRRCSVCRPDVCVAAFTSLGLLGTVGEAGLLHFRGTFHNPFMFCPVTLPPDRGRG